MTDVSLDREALALFEAMLEAEPADADAWLMERTARRPDLLSRVRALLAAERQVTLRTGGAVHSVEQGEAPSRLGAYIIGARIGAGGMGSVYLAKRDRGDFEHVAAIKIIRPGLLSARLVDRFRRERQILAQLRHPNIAQLFDGGETEDGSPYIIMEYVEGQSLLSWAEKTRPSAEERIDKLLQACAAVSFAHANLIVHRDITPSNVLVTSTGVVKLIDFGIARPAGQSAEGAPPLTNVSSLQTLSLTPGYAAPERMSGAEPTTAADIYSLGMLASKLLDASGGNRELIAIFARACAHEPQKRYPSVDLFAADLKAWREGYTVTAYAGGRGYAFGKFIGRHRGAVWATAIGLAVLLASFAATGVAFFRADQARAAEAKRFEEVRTLANYLLFDLNDQLRRVPGNTTARADLAAKAQGYLDALSRAESAARDVRMETALGYLRLAEIQNSPTSRNLGLTEEARRNLQRARDMLTFMEAKPTSLDVISARARADAADALIVFYQEKDAQRAERLLHDAIKSLDAIPLAQRTSLWHLARRDVSRAEMEFLSDNEQMPELKAAADKHDAFVAAWPSDIPADAATLEHAVAQYYRGLSFTYTNNDAGAYPLLRQAFESFSALEKARPGDPDLLYFIGWTGNEGYAAGERIGQNGEDLLSGAVAAAKRLVAIEDHDRSARTLNIASGETYAQHLSNTGRHAEAIVEQRRIIEVKRAAKALPDADLAWSEMMLGLIGKKAGDRALACESWTAANDHFTPVEQAAKLIPFHAAFLSGLRANLAVCAAGKPISAFVPLR